MKNLLLSISILVISALSFAGETQQQNEDSLEKKVSEIEAVYPAYLVEGLFYFCKTKIGLVGASGDVPVDSDMYCSIKVIEFLD